MVASVLKAWCCKNNAVWFYSYTVRLKILSPRYITCNYKLFGNTVFFLHFCLGSLSLNHLFFGIFLG